MLFMKGGSKFLELLFMVFLIRFLRVIVFGGVGVVVDLGIIS